MEDFEILIASVPDMEKPVAEIWFNNNLIAEINQGRDEFEIDLYPYKKLTFKLSALLRVLESAQQKLAK